MVGGSPQQSGPFGWTAMGRGPGYIRLTTHPRIMDHPLTPTSACSDVEAWLAQPQVTFLHPGNRHAATLFHPLRGLGTAGVNIVPVIAGLGLGGFALGFAFRDALSNLLAGVLIIIYQPFREGDTISVMGCQGRVTETNLRYTVLDNELEQFMVPNSLIFTKPLKIIRVQEKSKPL